VTILLSDAFLPFSGLMAVPATSAPLKASISRLATR